MHGREDHKELQFRAFRPKKVFHKGTEGREGTEVHRMLRTSVFAAVAALVATPLITAAEAREHLLRGVLLLNSFTFEAAEQFHTSLLRMQNRTLSPRGVARASKKSGSAEAARSSYEKLLEILSDSPENPSYQEAKDFVSDGE